MRLAVQRWFLAVSKPPPREFDPAKLNVAFHIGRGGPIPDQAFARCLANLVAALQRAPGAMNGRHGVAVHVFSDASGKAEELASRVAAIYGRLNSTISASLRLGQDLTLHEPSDVPVGSYQTLPDSAPRHRREAGMQRNIEITRHLQYRLHHLVSADILVVGGSPLEDVAAALSPNQVIEISGPHADHANDGAHYGAHYGAHADVRADGPREGNNAGQRSGRRASRLAEQLARERRAQCTLSRDKDRVGRLAHASASLVSRYKGLVTINRSSEPDGFGANLHAQMSAIAYARRHGKQYVHTAMGTIAATAPNGETHTAHAKKQLRSLRSSA